MYHTEINLDSCPHDFTILDSPIVQYGSHLGTCPNIFRYCTVNCIITFLLYINFETKRTRDPYKNAGQVSLAAGQVDFQVTCPARRVAVETIFEAGTDMVWFICRW